ncbi:MAG TPA: alpha/beta hydrolase fold domain-containing protein [Burkholderiales bacterium]|nr:alpha/beta hydrolase fold domain-containing protein [Burkholderiales bacterium]
MSSKVFLDYTQEELDRAYDQAVYAPNRDQLLARLAHTSELTRRRLGPPERQAYGELAIEGLDLYRTKAQRAPICVFVHGGAWRAGLARDYAFPAEVFLRAGAHYAALDFNNVLETGGDLMPMAEQVRRGIAWVCRNAERLGADPRRVYVTGTSSGAHLGGVAATTDWTRYGLSPNPIRGYTLASGMYDLRGPRLSKRSAYVKFTDDAEQALSPQRHLERVNAPIVLLFGSLETPEFQRQTRDFADALTRAGKSCELIRAEGYNHFELTETLGNPYGPLGRAVLAQMKLNSDPG